MEIFKEAKNQVMAILILLFFLLVTLSIYFSSINIDYKRGYDTPATELVL